MQFSSVVEDASGNEWKTKNVLKTKHEYKYFRSELETAQHHIL